MKRLAVVLGAVLFVSCAAAKSNTRVDEERVHEHGTFTKHYKESLFEVSDKGMFSAEIVFKEHELTTGINAVDIILHDNQDADVIGADVEVVPWMPEMGHGVFEKPLVTEKGGGLYTIENIILIMSGHWELRITIKAGSMEDRVVFDFPQVQVDRGHEHTMTAAPDNLDLSSEKLTEKETFSVSYKSRREPIPINTIHAWEIIVATPDGTPVAGAEISVDGDMPEHGHGLPTQPEVTEELGDGRYLVEGLKFSMPGWWSMHFNIEAGGREDRVLFNLMLKE